MASSFQHDLLPAVGDNSSSPTLGSTALARFEFEPGRGNEGTKILMVEWEDERQSDADWEIRWEGKTTTLSGRDGIEGKLRRLYFLLPPGVTVPRCVTLAQDDGVAMKTNPLPAIFPPQLGASARTAGKKGVLHTIWAKKRMSVLQAEIEREMKLNGEGIGLEMAIQEKAWIEDHFGVGPRGMTSEGLAPNSPSSPTSPKTPGGGRLAEKLRGLKLGTSAADLSLVEPAEPGRSLLSPDLDDIAVSSFSAFHGTTPRPRAYAQAPPTALVAKQQDGAMGKSRMGSLDALAGPLPAAVRSDTHDTEDGLFAVKLSPRSPDMTRSPFSLTTHDAGQAGLAG